MEDLDAGNDASGPGGGTASSSSSGLHRSASGGRSSNPHRRSGASRTALGSPLDAALQRKRREQAYLVAAMQVRRKWDCGSIRPAARHTRANLGHF